MARSGMVRPLGNVTPIPIWMENGSEYPIRILVLMENGHIIKYQAMNLDHGSALKAALDSFDRACFGRVVQKKKPMPLTEGTSSRG